MRVTALSVSTGHIGIIFFGGGCSSLTNPIFCISFARKLCLGSDVSLVKDDNMYYYIFVCYVRLNIK